MVGELSCDWSRWHRDILDGSLCAEAEPDPLFASLFAEVEPRPTEKHFAEKPFAACWTAFCGEAFRGMLDGLFLLLALCEDEDGEDGCLECEHEPL